MTNLSNYAPTEEEQQKRVGSEILSGAGISLSNHQQSVLSKRHFFILEDDGW